MRIDKLNVENFRLFRKAEFPLSGNLTVIIGNNGSGKSSLLEAIAVSLGAWQYASNYRKQIDRRDIEDREIHLKRFENGGRVQLEPQLPVTITAHGEVLGHKGFWTRALNILGGGTNISGNIYFREIVSGALSAARSGEKVILPIIAHYGTNRLWSDAVKNTKDNEVDKSSRLSAYKDAYHTVLSAHLLNKWIRDEEFAEFQRGYTPGSHTSSIKEVILGCMPEARRLTFSLALDQILVEFVDGSIMPFLNLSDGQRKLFTLVGDIARRALTLNPHLSDNAITQTPGVVLIDELDLHLHPQWQRGIPKILLKTFPSIQFVTTTHSPIIVSEISAENILVLNNGEASVSAEGYGLDAGWVTRHVMGTPTRAPEISSRINKIYELIEDEQITNAKHELSRLRQLVTGLDPELTEIEAAISRLAAEKEV